MLLVKYSGEVLRLSIKLDMYIHIYTKIVVLIEHCTVAQNGMAVSYSWIFIDINSFSFKIVTPKWTICYALSQPCQITYFIIWVTML